MNRALEQLSVAILSGGQSSRMGVDKARLAWGDGILIDQAIRVADSVERSAATLIIGDRAAYHGRGGRVVADLYPGLGPLGGIVTALKSAPSTRVLVLGVDMPTLSIELLNAMAGYPFEGDALVPLIERGDGGRAIPQTLHAIYATSCLPVFERALAARRLKIADALGELDVTYLDAAWARRYDPGLTSFANANTPGEYERIRNAAGPD